MFGLLIAANLCDIVRKGDYKQLVKEIDVRGKDFRTRCKDSTLLDIAFRRTYLVEGSAELKEIYYHYQQYYPKYQKIIRYLVGKYIQEMKKHPEMKRSILLHPFIRGASLLHMAAYAGDLEQVRYLLSQGLYVDIRDRYLNTPLHYAAIGGNLEVVKYLVKKGAQIDAIRSRALNNPSLVYPLVSDALAPHTPLVLAVFYKHKEVARYLVGEYIRRNKFRNERCILHFAAYGGDIEQVKFLVKKGFDVNRECRTEWFYNYPIHLAIWGGNMEILRYLIEKGVNMNVLDYKEKKAPLHYFAEKGNFEMVKYLVEKGADIHMKDAIGKTPLHYAAKEGHLQIVKYLVEKGADPEIKDYDGKTPLHYAAEGGHLEIVKYLVEEEEVEVDEKCLYEAAYYGRLNVVKYLLEETDTSEWMVPNTLDEALHEAAAYKSIEDNDCKLDVVKYLIKKGADVNSMYGYYNNSILHTAAYSCPEVIRYLIKKGAKIVKNDNGKTPLDLALETIFRYKNKKRKLYHWISVYIEQNKWNLKFKDGMTLLHVAAIYGDTNHIKILLKKGVDVNARDEKGETALHKAARKGRIDMVKVLVRNGADITIKNDSGKTALYIAAEKDHYDIVRYLVGALIKRGMWNVKLENNLTLLHYAAFGRDLSQVKYLIKKGIPVDAKDDDDITPLHLAAFNGHLNVVKYLIIKGADINAKTKSGYTPLYLAAWGNHLSVVKYLVQKGADVNTRIKSGETPLHDAAWRDHRDIARYLISKGADVNARNKDGYTPLHYAAKKGNTEIVSYLIKNGADVNTRSKDGDTPCAMTNYMGMLELLHWCR